MGMLDEPLQPEGAAIVGFNGKDMGWVAPPRAVTRKLPDRHDLNGIDPQLLQMIQPRRDGGELSRLAERAFIEGADMQLIDDQFIPGRAGKRSIVPGKGRIMNDRITGRVGDLTGIGIHAPEHTPFGGQLVAVGVADPGALNEDIPVPSRL